MVRSGGSVGFPLLACLALGLTLPLAALAAKLPSDLKRCARSDPKLNECLRLAIEDALPKLKGGIPKINFSPLDPLVIEQMSITQGDQGPVTLDLTFTNLQMTKVVDGVKITKMKFTESGDEVVLDSVIVTPQVISVGNYTINGKVLVLPVRGTGPAKITMDNVKSTMHITGKIIMKNGKKYLNINNVDVKLEPSKVVQQFDNLFNGDKALGDTTNRVINDNWETVYKEIGPSLSLAYSEVFKRQASQLFNKVPYDDVFPPTL